MDDVPPRPRSIHGGGFLTGFGKSPAKRYDVGQGKRVTFADVAGLEQVKGDLTEVVEFLRSPERFHKLGALASRKAPC